MKGGSSPRHDKLLDKDDLKVDLDSSFSHHGEFFFCDFVISFCDVNGFHSVPDLNSDDSYGTVVNLGMDQDGSSPHSGVGRGTSYLHGATSPPYLTGHSPPHGHEPFHYPDQLSVYTNLGIVVQ